MGRICQDFRFRQVRPAMPAGPGHTGQMPFEVNFLVVLRGYDRAKVDAVVRRVDDALESDSPEVRASARDLLRDCAFPVNLRGYDRAQVDEYLRQATSRLT